MGRSLLRILQILYKYSAHNLIFSLVGGYFLLSILLIIFFNINIGIPCLFRYFSGFKCPGCGLTHAFIHLLKLEFKEAFAENKFVFIVAAAGLYYIIKDFIAFIKKENLTLTTRK
jgi:hypothetical protein